MNNRHKFKKKYGQNFLRDKSVIERILSYVCLTKEDLVVEIGPGDGALTKELLKHTRVLAYEVDKELEQSLDCISDDLTVIWDDFLERNIKNDLGDFKYRNIYLIANLPYYITTPILLKVIEDNIEFKEIIVMVQKEVAERFAATPGGRDYSSITVFLNYYYDLEKLFNVSRNSFYPVPNVDSAIIRLKSKQNKVYIKNKDLFFRFIRDSFKYKRKTLKNNVKNYDLVKIEQVLNKHNLDLTVRAEHLSLKIFAEIVNNL